MNTVTLRMPASVDYVRLARLASADAGTRAGFDYEEIEDLKIAVTELCHIVIGDGATGDMVLELSTTPGEVIVTGRANEPGSEVFNEFADVILSKVADSHSVRSDGSGRAFDLSKRSRSATSAPGT